MDTELLQLLRVRATFDQFKPYLRPEVLAKQTAVLLSGMQDYYDAHPAETEIEWDSFATWMTVTKAKRLPEKEVKLLRALIERLALTPSTLVVQSDVLDYFIRVDYASRIEEVASKIVGGDDKADLGDVVDLVHDYEAAANRAISKTDLFADFSLSVVTASAAKPGWDWRLEELNRSLGPIRGGDFIILGARPEVGKTTFLADQTSYIAGQMQNAGVTRPIAWANNEERHDKVAFRIMQAALGLEQKVILGDPASYEALYDHKVGKSRILLPRSDAGFNHRKALESWFKEVRPAMIVFDQLDKVHGFSSSEDRDDLRIGKAYQWAREMAHQYDCPVITASQATGDAEGVEYVSQDMLRGSKTDKPGEADAIITIGKSADPKMEYERYINVPKNKLFGGPRSDEALRHGKFVVDIDPTIARYRGKVL